MSPETHPDAYASPEAVATTLGAALNAYEAVRAGYRLPHGSPFWITIPNRTTITIGAMHSPQTLALTRIGDEAIEIIHNDYRFGNDGVAATRQQEIYTLANDDSSYSESLCSGRYEMGEFTSFADGIFQLPSEDPLPAARVDNLQRLLLDVQVDLIPPRRLWQKAKWLGKIVNWFGVGIQH